MSRLRILGAIALFVQFASATPVVASKSKIAAAMGDLRWGMSEYEVERFAERHLKEHYQRAIEKARGAGAKAKLRADLAKRLKALGSGYVEFQGQATRWDRSPVAGEFTHGNGEGLIAVEDTTSKNFYFFIGGQLWKWVKVYDAATFGGKDFRRFSKLIQKRFGRGVVKEGVRLSGRNDEQRWVEFLDRRSRLRAVDLTRGRAAYALVFEHMDTVRDLSTLRTNVPKRQTRMAEKEPGDSGESRQPVSTGPSKDRRSIFADERTVPDPRAERRRKREEAAQAKQRRTRQRQPAKKDSALKGVSGSKSDDPLAGL